MAYREVTRVEAKEVLRQWLAGTGNKRIAVRVGLDVKTVRRYVSAAQALGLTREHSAAALTDELISTLLGTEALEAQEATAAPGRARAVCDAASVCGRRA